MSELSFSPGAETRSGGQGCLLGFLIPPLGVVILGLLFFGKVSAADNAVNQPADQPSPPTAPAHLAPLFTEEVLHWEAKILRWSAQYNLDPNLVATVMQIESCGNPDAQSGAGARGLFQVMPYHFQDGEDPFHPGTNARRGLAYLEQALKKGGSSRLALAGYNGGITGAQRPEEYWPAETRRYVYWGKGIYRDARKGLEHSARLEEWLASGGASLCTSASRTLKLP
jgi:hypothetical protein